MKSEERYLITKYYRDMTCFTTLDEYIEKVRYWKEGECGMAPCYIEEKYLYGNYDETRITKEEIERYLFLTKEEAINRLKEYLIELLNEYELKINYIKKIILDI